MATRLFAIDPGCTQSAIVALDFAAGALPAITQAEILPNLELLEYLRFSDPDGIVLVIEKIEGMGMAVGVETFETVFWSGRFAEAWRGRWDRISRRDVKLHLCGQSRAKDGNVWQALVDLWGGSAAVLRATKGTKSKPGREPGPLAGIHSHTRAALAVGVTWKDSHSRKAAKVA